MDSCPSGLFHLGGGGGEGGPWTINIYSARALCFLGLFSKTSLGLGSRLALQRGRRSIGSLCGEGHEEETVKGGGNILLGEKRGEAWTMHDVPLTDGFGGGEDKEGGERTGSVTFG